MIFVGTTVKKNNEDSNRKNDGPQSNAFEALTDRFLLSYLELLTYSKLPTDLQIPNQPFSLLLYIQYQELAFFSLVRVVYNNPALLLSSISTKQRLMKNFIF
jgi:hypothetical protein